MYTKDKKQTFNLISSSRNPVSYYKDNQISNHSSKKSNRKKFVKFNSNFNFISLFGFLFVCILYPHNITAQGIGDCSLLSGPGFSISSGDFHSCLILENKSLKCWGENSKGQLGLGDNKNMGDNIDEMGMFLPFVDLGTNFTVNQISLGGDHCCAVSSKETLKCWGDNNNGELGLGDYNNRGDGANEMSNDLPLVDLGNYKILKVASGKYHVCAILENNRVKCWGQNIHKQLGFTSVDVYIGDYIDEMGTNLPLLDLGSYTNGTNFKVIDIALGDYHSCAILGNYGLKCWGNNQYGQLGLGNTNNKGEDNHMGNNLPFIYFGSYSNGANFSIIQVSCGSGHTCVLLDNKMVKCFGYNEHGQLGLEDTENRGDSSNEMGNILNFLNFGSYPNGTNYTVKKISVGGQSSCAILDNDQIKCWGNNTYGQLGLGDTNNRGTSINDMGNNLPLVSLGSYNNGINLSVISISSGSTFNCVLINDGQVKCWGNNQYGQLGLGHKINRGFNSSQMGDSLSFVEVCTVTINPTTNPTANPTIKPSIYPTTNPSANPTIKPSIYPTTNPSANPTIKPSIYPSANPTIKPSIYPSANPTIKPSIYPTTNPTTNPTIKPSIYPTTNPTTNPTIKPSIYPTTNPTDIPTIKPSIYPTTNPTDIPTIEPSIYPTTNPNANPTIKPSIYPTTNPTDIPTIEPTQTTTLTIYPTNIPTIEPIIYLTNTITSPIPRPILKNISTILTTSLLVSRNFEKKHIDDYVLIIIGCIALALIISLISIICRLCNKIRKDEKIKDKKYNRQILPNIYSVGPVNKKLSKDEFYKNKNQIKKNNNIEMGKKKDIVSNNKMQLNHLGSMVNANISFDIDKVKSDKTDNLNITNTGYSDDFVQNNRFSIDVDLLQNDKNKNSLNNEIMIPGEKRYSLTDSVQHEGKEIIKRTNNSKSLNMDSLNNNMPNNCLNDIDIDFLENTEIEDNLLHDDTIYTEIESGEVKNVSYLRNSVQYEGN